MLSRLGRDEDALILLNEFEEEKRLSQHTNYDPYDINRLEYQLLDEKVKAADARTKFDDRPVEVVLVSALGVNYPNQRDIQRLTEFSADEYYQYFVAAEQDQLLYQLSRLCALGANVVDADARFESIRETAKTAARLLAEQSLFNRIKLETTGLIEPLPKVSE